MHTIEQDFGNSRQLSHTFHSMRTYIGCQVPLNLTPYTLHPTFYTLHPAPYTLHPASNTQVRCGATPVRCNTTV